MELVYPKEKSLFAISLALSSLFWVTLLVGTLGLVLVYVLFFFVVYLFAQSAFISYLRGTAVQITPEQFPDLHQRFVTCCGKVGVKKIPDAYLMHGNGVFNALATRFLGRDIVVLYSDVVDALEPAPGAINFYIGHELGHVHRKHLIWGPVLFPAGILPLLGAAYSRAREYTCDRYGLACTESPQDAVHGIGALAAGAQRWRSLNRERYMAQTQATSGFWMSFHELVGDYPWLVKRLAAIATLGADQKPKPPRRNVFAFLLALLVPRLGIAGGAGSMLVVVAIIGILAAIAIPQYQDYVHRTRVMSGLDRMEPVKRAVVEYTTNNRAWPSDAKEIGIRTEPGAYGPNVSSVVLAQRGVIVVTFSGGTITGKSVAWVPGVQDGRIVWRCASHDLPNKLLPVHCR